MSTNIDAAKHQQRDAELVDQMMRTDGWLILERDINIRREALIKALVIAIDLHEIYRLQAEVRALEYPIHLVNDVYKRINDNRVDKSM